MNLAVVGPVGDHGSRKGRGRAATGPRAVVCVINTQHSPDPLVAAAPATVQFDVVSERCRDCDAGYDTDLRRGFQAAGPALVATAVGGAVVLAVGGGLWLAGALQDD